MEYNLGVLNNPNARRNLTSKGMKEAMILDILHDVGLIAVVKKTLNHEDSLDEAIEEFMREGVNMVVVNGGDGTLMRTVTKFKRIGYDPYIAPLNGGTMNNLSYCCDIKGRPPQVLRDLALLVKSGEDIRFKTQHLVNVNGNYGQIFAISPAAYRFIEEYDKSPDIKEVGKLISKALLSPEYRARFKENLKGEIKISGEGIEEELLKGEFMIAIGSTVPRICTGLRLFYRMDDPRNHDAKKMHVLVPYGGVDENKANIVRGVGAGVLHNFGLPFQWLWPSGFYDGVADEVVIESSRMGIIIDSERLPPADKVTIDCKDAIEVPRIYRGK
ncbi:MAG: NAD(+)/NADH kinase [Nanoarchaeota archaeon]|nr:NAD(+)/NADH kinase [Nanoarchaeota archaeon]